MLDIFKILFTFFRRRRSAHIDGLVFQLHYRVTVALLLLFTVIIGMRQYLWSPIVCYGDDVSRDVLNAYCWTHSTHTVKSAFNSREDPFPGVSKGDSKDKNLTRTHRYYQWVVLCLFLQAILFYIPRWLWRRWEGGILHRLRNNLSQGFASEEEKNKKSEYVLEYLRSNLNTHEWWAKKYFVCEVLAFVNVLGQMFLMNRFLGGVFWDYGTEVLNFIETDSEERVDPMIQVFPEVTKCEFRKYSPSGLVQKHDAICVLPLNLLNQKFYFFLWFWCIFLLVITSLCLLYRFAVLWKKSLRLHVLRMRHRHIRGNVLDALVLGIKPGDWLLLYFLGENVEPEVYKELLHEIVHRVVDQGKEEKIEFESI